MIVLFLHSSKSLLLKKNVEGENVKGSPKL